MQPEIGTVDDVVLLASRLRERGISLCLDFVCNHTASNHRWARRAASGDAEYQGYYWMFPDRTKPDAYEATLREFFPSTSPGNFTWSAECRKWVWTTFNGYQWDLNYTNPAVFLGMLDNMLFLANLGAEVLRLDAVAFLWKRIGTRCESLPEAHALLQAFRALSGIVAPATIHKAEAIVPATDLVAYLGVGRPERRECHLAYNNVLMASLWSCLASGKAELLEHAVGALPVETRGSAWVTFARCHDDISWLCLDTDVAALGLDGESHREFLYDFYRGEAAGSFARGVGFQADLPGTDQRICGTMASLAGLEEALEEGSAEAVDLAVRRVLLLYAVILAYPGVPVVNMGDEIGLLNDDSYLSDPVRCDDHRWIHRPAMDWRLAAARFTPETPAKRIFDGLRCRIAARVAAPALSAAAGEAKVIPTGHESIFGLERQGAEGRLLVLANFSEHEQVLSRRALDSSGWGVPCFDWVSDAEIDGTAALELAGYQCLWLDPDPPARRGAS